jgi:hypothetical protein
MRNAANVSLRSAYVAESQVVALFSMPRPHVGFDAFHSALVEVNESSCRAIQVGDQSNRDGDGDGNQDQC